MLEPFKIGPWLYVTCAFIVKLVQLLERFELDG